MKIFSQSHIDIKTRAFLDHCSLEFNVSLEITLCVCVCVQRGVITHYFHKAQFRISRKSTLFDADVILIHSNEHLEYVIITPIE